MWRMTCYFNTFQCVTHHYNPAIGEWNIVLTDMPGFLSGMGANRLNFTKVYIRGNRATYSKPISHKNNAGAYSEVSTKMITDKVDNSAKLSSTDFDLFEDARWDSVFGRTRNVHSAVVAREWRGAPDARPRNCGNAEERGEGSHGSARARPAARSGSATWIWIQSARLRAGHAGVQSTWIRTPTTGPIGAVWHGGW